MTQLQNQFIQSVEKGQVDLKMSSNTISCMVKDDESTALLPGQAVKLADVAGGAPIVTAVDDDTDVVFGIVSYNVKDSDFPASSYVEISSHGNVIYLEASAAIARGGLVMAVVSGEKIATATSAKTIVGVALDKAAADGDLIRVLLGFAQHLAA